ncbi:MAG: phospholipase D-like domain-containing protein, partial [Myxococcota bacterium]
MIAWVGGGSEARADDLRLVLHDPTGRAGPADVCDAPVCTSLLALIEGATTSIDFAFYGFRDQTRLLEAMTAAKARGVKIRGVVDLDVDHRNYYESTPSWIAALGDIRDDFAVDVASAAHQRSFAGIRYKCPRPPGFAGPLQCLAIDLGDRCYLSAHVSREPIRFEGDIMHDKFAVVDHRYVWTGSTNASDSCTGGYNANLVWVIDAPTVAAWYTAELDQMYDGGRFHDAKAAQPPMRLALGPDVSLELSFSPQHHPIEATVQPLIRSAQRSIDVAVFYLTHKGIAQDLIDAHLRGVAVRVIVDGSSATNAYSKHEVLRLAGIPVKVEDFGGKMHAKSAVIDGSIVIGGSMNWTNAGEDGNDENTVVVRSAVHAAQYQQWFDRLWAEIPDRWLQDRPDPESVASGRACADGVDNDYDGLTDAADPG